MFFMPQLLLFRVVREASLLWRSKLIEGVFSISMIWFVDYETSNHHRGIFAFNIFIYGKGAVQLIHESFLITYLNSDSTYLFITVARNLVNRSTAWFYEILMSCTNKKSRNTSRQHSGNSTCFLFLTYACAWNQLIYTVNAQADHNI